MKNCHCERLEGAWQSQPFFMRLLRSWGLAMTGEQSSLLLAMTHRNEQSRFFYQATLGQYSKVNLTQQIFDFKQKSPLFAWDQALSLGGDIFLCFGLVALPRIRLDPTYSSVFSKLTSPSYSSDGEFFTITLGRFTSLAILLKPSKSF